MRELKETGNRLIDNALEIAFEFADFDGAHHKQWVIDQMVVALCGGEDSAEYSDFIEAYEQPSDVEVDLLNPLYEYEDGEDGEPEEDTYFSCSYEDNKWDKGIAP